MNESALRELLTLQEKYHTAVSMAKDNLVAGQRQLIEKMMQRDVVIPNAAVSSEE
jgi:uncharacterized protein (DUF305 family)